LVASSDQDFGTSTFSCLKMTFPASSVISAVRRSHSIWSNGLIFGSLKTRSSLRNSRLDGAFRREPFFPVKLDPRRRVDWVGADTTSSVASIMVVLFSWVVSTRRPLTGLQKG
jgi:hypothetical protein